jgi:hypothetical protein
MNAREIKTVSDIEPVPPFVYEPIDLPEAVLRILQMAQTGVYRPDIIDALRPYCSKRDILRAIRLAKEFGLVNIRQRAEVSQQHGSYYRLEVFYMPTYEEVKIHLQMMGEIPRKAFSVQRGALTPEEFQDWGKLGRRSIEDYYPLLLGTAGIVAGFIFALTSLTALYFISIGVAAASFSIYFFQTRRGR